MQHTYTVQTAQMARQLWQLFIYYLLRMDEEQRNVAEKGEGGKGCREGESERKRERERD